MALRWLNAALADLRAIKSYIAEENPQAADRVIASIHKETIALLNQPNIGRAGRITDTRELVISQYPYIVAYREQSGEVEILAVVHTSRRWPEQLSKGSS
ncbi:MAG: type II toxin-antitoxin system RelE/ParE family toxin [Gallionella sp.]|nr:type II toxin-antitoxin system RelE/ParE family toxin [Gallionella sp.]